MKEEIFFLKMFQDPQTRQMNFQNVSKKSLSDELFLHFSSEVQNLTVFSIIYIIRIRFFGPGELIQNIFSSAQYVWLKIASAKEFHMVAGRW